jgi:hypothetical protein
MGAASVSNTAAHRVVVVVVDRRWFATPAGLNAAAVVVVVDNIPRERDAQMSTSLMSRRVDCHSKPVPIAEWSMVKG